MNFFKWLFGLFKKPKQIKLGLALGSGGAKGFAELGALKALEEAGLEFDYVAGTSIGSIVGAFYADGYSSTDIYELLGKVGYMEIIKGPMIKMNTSGLQKVVDRNIGGKKIEELKKPFMAVATEVESGTEFVFKSGSVAVALAASSCYQPYFKPVVVGDKRYVDGAYTNSIPADLVKEMGADYIVSIDLADKDAKPGRKGVIPWEKGYTYSDTMLHPDLSGFTPLSFGEENRAKMFEIGYNTALERLPKIKEDIEKLKQGKKIK